MTRPSARITSATAGSESRPYPIVTTFLLMTCLAGGVLAGQTLPPPSAERLAFDAWLDGHARTALESRRAKVAALTTREAVEARQREVRAAIAEALGLLPASAAPVTATITRTTRRDGYRIEHLWFESLPGLRVTANAYVPDGPGPFPVVIGTAGHADEGKATPIYQHAWVSLARRGFLVLAYDPFGQGERIEYPGPAAGTSRVGIGTGEHTMTGQQVLLTGRTVGAYMVHDMRRALDYLASRPDVDPTRIAVAGNSGGGTQAALLGAVEPRLAAVVVSCYMTSWADMWTTPGPQDAEQILPGFVGRGLDFADFALAAAPRGFLVSSAIQDYFPIAGSRSASAELTALYTALGAPDKLARVENDATHGWSQPLREGAYQALGTWLGRPVVPATEAPVTPEALDALRVTPTGQLSTSGGSRTVRSLNAAEAVALGASRPAVTPAALATLVGDLDAVAAARIVERRGDAASPAGEHLLVEVTPGVRLRAWLRRPATPSGPAVLLVDEKGATLRGATVETLVADGHAVLALDIRGTGDLGPRVGVSGYAPAYQFAARAWLLGTSVVAWQSYDIAAGVRLLQSLAPSGPGVQVRAGGQTGPAALFAAQAVRPAQVVLEESLVSYLDLARADVHSGATLAVMPGVLRVTDLPELMARLAPTRVHLLRSRGPDGRTLAAAEVVNRFGGPMPANVIVDGVPASGTGPGQPPPQPRSVEPRVGQAGKDVMWVPTSAALIEKMLDMARVTRDDLVMDLGSGDGRTIIAAARRGARAVGVEFSPDLVTLSRRLAEEAGVGTRATFVEGDMYTADISKATVLALFLLPPNLERLRDTFLALAPGSRIVINTFAIPGWEPDAQETLGTCAVYCTSLLYVVPARVQGRWKTTRGELVLEQRFQFVSGTLTAGGRSTPVTGRLRGAELEIIVGSDTLRGTVTGERIAGALSGARVPAP